MTGWVEVHHQWILLHSSFYSWRCNGLAGETALAQTGLKLHWVWKSYQPFPGARFSGRDNTAHRRPVPLPGWWIQTTDWAAGSLVWVHTRAISFELKKKNADLFSFFCNDNSAGPRTHTLDTHTHTLDTHTRTDTHTHIHTQFSPVVKNGSPENCNESWLLCWH